MDRNVGVLRVSLPLLIQALHLPPDVVVTAVGISIQSPDAIELRIEHRELPLVAHGTVVPVISASFETKMMDGPSREVSFVEWVL